MSDRKNVDLNGVTIASVLCDGRDILMLMRGGSGPPFDSANGDNEVRWNLPMPDSATQSDIAEITSTLEDWRDRAVPLSVRELSDHVLSIEERGATKLRIRFGSH